MGTPFNFLNSINLAPTGLERFWVTLVGIIIWIDFCCKWVYKLVSVNKIVYIILCLMIPVDVSVERQKKIKFGTGTIFFYAVHYCYLFKSLKYPE